MCSPSGIRDNEAVTIRITALCAPQPGTAHFTPRHCICMQPWLCPGPGWHHFTSSSDLSHKQAQEISGHSRILPDYQEFRRLWNRLKSNIHFVLFMRLHKRSYVTSNSKWVSTNAIYIMPLSNQRERGKALCFLSLKDTLMSWHEVNGTAGERLESVTGWRWGDSICQDQDHLLAATHKNPPNITDADTDSGHQPASRRDAIQQKLYKWLTRNFFSPRVIDNQNNWLLFAIIYPAGSLHHPHNGVVIHFFLNLLDNAPALEGPHPSLIDSTNCKLSTVLGIESDMSTLICTHNQYRELCSYHLSNFPVGYRNCLRNQLLRQLFTIWSGVWEEGDNCNDANRFQK